MQHPKLSKIIQIYKNNYPGEATHHFAGAGTSPSNDEPQFIREAAPIFATTAVADAAAVAAAAVGTGAAAAVATPVAVAAVAVAGIAAAAVEAGVVAFAVAVSVQLFCLLRFLLFPWSLLRLTRISIGKAMIFSVKVGLHNMDGPSWGLEWPPYGEPKCLHFHRKSNDSEVSRWAGIK